MPTTVNAYRSNEPGGRLEPYQYELGDLGHGEVDIDVESCGICYSDVSMIDNDWGFTPYPITPTRSVGEIPYCRNGVNTVTPPHMSGPAVRGSTPSGIGSTAAASARTMSA